MDFNFRYFAIVLAAVSFEWGWAQLDDLSDDDMDKDKDIVQVMVDNSDFSAFVGVLKEAGLLSKLKESGPFTVFAPSNESFNRLGEVLDDLLLPKNRDLLRKVLLDHIVSGEIISSNMKNMTLETEAGGYLSIKVDNGKIMVNGAEVIWVDIDASNGVIHLINKVIL